MTSRELEREKHLRWPSQRYPKLQPLLDQLLEHEFSSGDELHAWQCEGLRRMTQFAATEVPYYLRQFQQLGLSPDAISSPAELPRLPILSKQDVISHGDDLRARTLPPGERATTVTSSSGTTGRPVRVWQTADCNQIFAVLWHRQARWFDLDPRGTFLDVRIAREIGRDAQNRPNPDGQVVCHPRWRYLGQFCDTGPEFGFNMSNPAGRQCEWLREQRPSYAMSYPGVFEEWLLASEGRPPIDTLKCLIGVGTQLSPSLRRRLEQAYQIPIHQTYGLNEFGKVALRCDAGRYHVHAEHCHVEIADAQGQLCAAGQLGKVLVTTLRNFAMPLVRYDTGDLAEAVSGPCPCGRTLPSFGEIAGRYRRYAGLPAGSRQRVNAILKAFDEASPPMIAFLRRYQIHQDRNDHFTLRLQTVKPIAESFREHMQRAWGAVEPRSELILQEVETIALSPSGKLLDFASDFYTDPCAATNQETNE